MQRSGQVSDKMEFDSLPYLITRNKISTYWFVLGNDSSVQWPHGSVSASTGCIMSGPLFSCVFVTCLWVSSSVSVWCIVYTKHLGLLDQGLGEWRSIPAYLLNAEVIHASIDWYYWDNFHCCLKYTRCKQSKTSRNSGISAMYRISTHCKLNCWHVLMCCNTRYAWVLAWWSCTVVISSMHPVAFLGSVFDHFTCWLMSLFTALVARQVGQPFW